VLLVKENWLSPAASKPPPVVLVIWISNGTMASVLGFTSQALRRDGDASALIFEPLINPPIENTVVQVAPVEALDWIVQEFKRGGTGIAVEVVVGWIVVETPTIVLGVDEPPEDEAEAQPTKTADNAANPNPARLLLRL